MTGILLQGKGRLYVASAIFAVITVALWCCGVVFSSEPAGVGFLVFSCLPLALALSFWFHRRKAFEAEIQADCLHFHSGPYDDIPFSDLQGVLAEDKNRDRTTVHVLHKNGLFSIPPQQDLTTSEVVTCLVSQISEHNQEEASGDLQKVIAGQVAKFGAEQVYIYLPRRRMVTRQAGRGMRAFSIGTMVGTLLMVIAAAFWNAFEPKANAAPGLIGIGVFFFLISMLMLVISGSRSTLSGGHSKWFNSGVVITPQGLALIQGTLRGEMQWAELKKVVFPSKRRSFESTQDSRTGSISLEFPRNEGVEIFDIYNHPLKVIHARIMQYWQPEGQ
jgi:hypothetical protein